jgi:hypothetical protein
MDSRDLIVLGLVGVGGWLAWRWYTNRPVANAQSAPLMGSGSVAGLNTSSMTTSGASSTVYGGGFLNRRLLAPPVSPGAAPKLPAPTASAGAVARLQLSAFKPVEAIVSSAALSPTPTAPSPNNDRFTATGLVGSAGTMPAGELDPLGAPGKATILQTRGIQ